MTVYVFSRIKYTANTQKPTLIFLIKLTFKKTILKIQMTTVKRISNNLKQKKVVPGGKNLGWQPLDEKIFFKLFFKC